MAANGIDDIRKTRSGASAVGSYKDGTWMVVIKVPLSGPLAEYIDIKSGAFIPTAFAAWDGSNGDEGARHVLTTWRWIFIEPGQKAGILLWPLIVFVAAFGALSFWAARLNKG